MIKAVIFDMDGLMFDTERMWHTFWAPAMEPFGLKPTQEFAYAMMGTTGEVGQKVMRSFYGEDIDAPAIAKEFYRIAEEEFQKPVPEKEGLQELVKLLNEMNIPMAVASSSSEQMILRNLRNAGIAEYFTAIIGGTRVKRGKPNPDIFLLAASELEVAPADALVLEDSYNGVRAGAAGGFYTVMIPDVLPATPEMEQLADKILPSLSEVARLLRENAL